MATDKTTLGKVSLGTSIIGVFLPILLAYFIEKFTNPSRHYNWAYTLCIVLFLLLEEIALCCGISAKITKTGKAGMVLSSLLLGLWLCSLSIWRA